MDVHIISQLDVTKEISTDSKTFSDDYLVTGLFFAVADPNQPGQPFDMNRGASSFMETLLNNLRETAQDFSGSSKLNMTLSLQQLVGAEMNNMDGSPFVMYNGSLTTPPCWEAVQWAHFVNPIYISFSQWQDFRLYLKYSSRPVVPRYTDGQEPKDAKNSEANQKEFDLKWGYDGAGGVYTWPNFYSNCEAGPKQSPTDLGLNPYVTMVSGNDTILPYGWGVFKDVPVTKSSRRGIRFEPIYAFITDRNAEIRQAHQDANNATSADYSKYKKNGSTGEPLYEIIVPPTTIVDDREYVIDDIRFHTTSEHMINGTYLPMEMQIIHRAQMIDNSTLIISIFFDIANSPVESGFDPLLGDLFQFARTSPMPFPIGPLTPEADLAGVVNGTIPRLNLYHFAQHLQNTDLYVYDGSLSAPPCQTGVKWYIAKKPMLMSFTDWQAMSYIFNSRPLSKWF